MLFSYDQGAAIVAYRVALGGGVGTHVRRRGLGGIWKRVEGTCLALANSWGGLSLLRPTLLLGESLSSLGEMSSKHHWLMSLLNLSIAIAYPKLTSVATQFCKLKKFGQQSLRKQYYLRRTLWCLNIM